MNTMFACCWSGVLGRVKKGQHRKSLVLLLWFLNHVIMVEKFLKLLLNFPEKLLPSTLFHISHPPPLFLTEERFLEILPLSLCLSLVSAERNPNSLSSIKKIHFSQMYFPPHPTLPRLGLLVAQ